MAKKGKAKISKVKRNNQTTNKMKKQGKMKLQRHRAKPQKQKQTIQPQQEWSDDSDSASGDEWADMLDEEEQQYIAQRIAKQPHLLANVPQQEEKSNRAIKRKRKEKLPKPKKPLRNSDSGAESEEDCSDLEEKYEKDMSERPNKRLRQLLPIKTKEGIQERTEECDDAESEEEEEESQPDQKEVTQDEEMDSDSGMEGTADDEVEGGVVTTVQLMATRRDRLNHDKLRIGALCSSLLESPEKKLKNLFPILYLMEERLKDGTLNLHSVRKIATLSAYEVFKDILPEYQIRHQDYSNIKLKKDTLALYKFEKELVEFYKRYLQRLEKTTSALRRKKGDTRKSDEYSTQLAVISVQCMCGLLAARPHFNYATNIAQSVVPLLDSRMPEVHRLVTDCCVTIFKEDSKGDITLVIVRLINQLVKRRGERLNPSALDCLLALDIRDVDLDEDADLKHKKKQEEKHKKRIVNLSKKEKKRAKKLKEVERELLETEAQESSVARKKQLTEVTRTVFHIYFRLLKEAPGSKLLMAALDGIAKFSHVINVEVYSDLVGILGALVKAQESTAARLACVRCVLRVLAGAGDALSLDPATFHAALYADMLHVHCGGSSSSTRSVVECVEAVVTRARRVPPAVLQALAKRCATLSTQLTHEGALAVLSLLHRYIQHKPVASLLEQEAECLAGRFDPTLPSPEHCGAHAAFLNELSTLTRHFHPTVREAARTILDGRTLPATLQKLSPIQILKDYDGSQMSFKPSVQSPSTNAKTNRAPSGEHVWSVPRLAAYCRQIVQIHDAASTTTHNIFDSIIKIN